MKPANSNPITRMLSDKGQIRMFPSLKIPWPSSTMTPIDSTAKPISFKTRTPAASASPRLKLCFHRRWRTPPFLQQARWVIRLLRPYFRRVMALKTWFPVFLICSRNRPKTMGRITYTKYRASYSKKSLRTCRISPRQGLNRSTISSCSGRSKASPEAEAVAGVGYLQVHWLRDRIRSHRGPIWIMLIMATMGSLITTWRTAKTKTTTSNVNPRSKEREETARGERRTRGRLKIQQGWVPIATITPSC